MNNPNQPHVPPMKLENFIRAGNAPVMKLENFIRAGNNFRNLPAEYAANVNNNTNFNGLPVNYTHLEANIAPNLNAPPMHIVNDRDITRDDINGCFNAAGTINMDYFTSNILPILTNQRQTIKRSGFTHKLDCTAYDTVYVTSDLHADYRKFLQILSNSGMITLPKKINAAGGQTDLDLFSDDIYETSIITNTIWNDRRTCLIILGDLVDGRRGRTQQVNDRLGKFEMLLHMFLFNLRRKALLENSLVLFTLGNHDYHGLYDINEPNGDYFFNNYVHDFARAVFVNKENRKNFLLPFYNVHPLIYVSIINPTRGGREEMVGIHAGFHSHETKAYIMPELSNIQSKINNYGLYQDPEINIINSMKRSLIQNEKTKLFNQFILKDDAGNQVLNDNGDPIVLDDGGLWSRFYEDPAACELIQRESPIMFVVGHCNTISYDSNNVHSQIKHAHSAPGKLYEGCMGTPARGAGRGCVVLSCDNKLAHVDVGMSTSFFPTMQGGFAWAKFNETADKEMLRLRHDPSLMDEARYYNIIERYSKEKLTEMFRAAAKPVAPSPAGGGRRRYMKRQKTRRLINRRKSTRRRHRR